MVWAIRFRIFYLITHLDHMLTEWEYDFLMSLFGSKQLYGKQEQKVLEIWEQRKIKDKHPKYCGGYYPQELDIDTADWHLYNRRYHG